MLKTYELRGRVRDRAGTPKRSEEYRRKPDGLPARPKYKTLTGLKDAVRSGTNAAAFVNFRTITGGGGVS
ncbi:hypothetical protein [Pontibacter ruber]|uniref:Uncharacterized protein n=1 Tax=Pontibacter ruber TaxID=1343895 RepID=A0ABW5CV08_9BACT|nr:hypothetical protein [Pontibacter ruber]